MSENQNMTDAEQQVADIFENLTPEQMIQNDIDTASSAREYRKIAQGAMKAAAYATIGRGGMTTEQKVEALATARDRAVLAVEALNKAIDATNAAAKDAPQD